MSNYKAENNRKDRIFNIATAILEIHKSGKEGARTEKLREYIRERLGLPTLSGESWLGDLRAHGDALGGHGLKLEVIRKRIGGKDQRIIMFTENNISACAEYLVFSEIEESSNIL